VDWLKGIAILCVIGIHAKIYDETLFHQHVVNRAVPMFLILFAVTSELWWERAERPLASWYRKRLTRLYVPWWGMTATWWLFVVLSGRARAMDLGLPEAIETALGYAPWIGTSWFVTVVLQLVLLYPALRWAFERLGAEIALPITAATCWVSGMHMVPIILAGKRLLGPHVPEPGFYVIWIFVPRVFWNAAAGYFIARRWGGRPPKAATWLAAALTLLGVLVVASTHLMADDATRGPFLRQTLYYLFDVPLTVMLLGVLPALAPFTRLTRFLTWCGLSSWGIYLGHTLVHDLLHTVAGIGLESGPEGLRVLYGVFLFACGAALAVIGERLRRSLSVSGGVALGAGRGA
jgi:surface polysaccharide O-acyltransferase-like enzyme